MKPKCSHEKEEIDTVVIIRDKSILDVQGKNITPDEVEFFERITK